jgi:hypothetical protein
VTAVRRSRCARVRQHGGSPAGERLLRALKPFCRLDDDTPIENLLACALTFELEGNGQAWQLAMVAVEKMRDRAVARRVPQAERGAA